MPTINIPQKQFIASFDIDCQNTFTPVCPEELPVPEGDLIANSLNQQAELARLRVASKDAHSRQAIWMATESEPTLSPISGDNVDVRWPAHAIVGSKGFDLIEGLPAVTDYDFFVWKGIELDMHPYGACFHDFAECLSTGVIEYLRQENITTILAGGLATDYCVRATVLQLLKAGFDVIVNLSACRGIADESTAAAIDEMQQAGAICIADISDLQKG